MPFEFFGFSSCHSAHFFVILIFWRATICLSMVLAVISFLHHPLCPNSFERSYQIIFTLWRIIFPVEIIYLIKIYFFTFLCNLFLHTTPITSFCVISRDQVYSPSKFHHTFAQHESSYQKQKCFQTAVGKTGRINDVFGMMILEGKLVHGTSTMCFKRINITELALGCKLDANDVNNVLWKDIFFLPTFTATGFLISSKKFILSCI